MPRGKTTFNANSIKFSPFVDGRIAVATAQNFGIIGNGRQHVFQMEGGGAMREVAAYDTLDGLYDCAWSEANENVLLAACGDGSIKLYDISAPHQANPLRQFKEHTRECCSLSANMHQRELFLSSAWDDTIKMWSLNAPHSIRTFTGHTYCVYQVVWSPAHGDVFMSASGDTTVKLWDLRQQHPTLNLPAHGYEVLTADWCKYNDCIVATGSVDKTIKIWDVRQTSREMLLLMGHNYAVKRVMWSPHAEHLLASASYDMTVKLWDTAAPGRPLAKSWEHHSEFAVGLDWSMLQSGLMGSAGWDEQVAVWHMDGAP